MPQQPPQGAPFSGQCWGTRLSAHPGLFSLQQWTLAQFADKTLVTFFVILNKVYFLSFCVHFFVYRTVYLLSFPQCQQNKYYYSKLPSGLLSHLLPSTPEYQVHIWSHADSWCLTLTSLHKHCSCQQDNEVLSGEHIPSKDFKERPPRRGPTADPGAGNWRLFFYPV